MATITIHEASIILGVPEFLVRDFVSFKFNGQKLPLSNSDSDLSEFLLSDVLNYKNHLEKPWSGKGRRAIPKHVRRYLIWEARGSCSICHTKKENYEWAHIRSWPISRCNSPHNLLRLCLDCHTSYGNDEKLLRSVKEECLRRNQLIDLSLLYDCDADITPGEAVYVLNGRVHRAHAGATRDELAGGFIQTKIGLHRCTVQRAGVVVAIDNLETGKEYCLSATVPGKVVTRAGFDRERDKQRHRLVQFLGRAESTSHLAILIESDMELKPGTLLDV